MLTNKLSSLQKLIIYELQTNERAIRYANLTGNYPDLLREVALKYQTRENPLVYTVNGRPRIVNKFKVAFSRSLRSLEKKGFVILVYANEYNRNKVKSVFLTEKGWRCRVKNWGNPKKRHKMWSDDIIEQLIVNYDIGLSKELYEKGRIIEDYAPDDVKNDFYQGRLSINRAWQLTLLYLYLESIENTDEG